MTSRILVVDDEAPFELIVRKIFRKEVEDGHYLFFFAGDGEAALALMSREQVDIVVTDINMPKMDGLTLLSRIQERFPRMVTVVISAYGDLDNIRTTMNNGAFDFLVKPVDRSDFRKTLAKCARQAQHLREAAEAQQEKQRAQREIMAHFRRMDQLKDEFLANISHELLTPLNGIVGIADSLADGAGGPISKVVENNLSMIVTSGKRLTSLVHDILDFARIKNSELRLKLKPLDLRPLIEVVLALSRPLMEGKSLRLRANLPANLPMVLADENRVQQILHNLVGNAIKFTSVGEVAVRAVPDGGFVRLTVADTGLGIPAEKLEHIFEAFERMDGSDADIYAGTGLGLTITKKLVQLMGGEVFVNSDESLGSEFSVTFPLAGGTHAEAADEAETILDWHNEDYESTYVMPQPGQGETFRLLAVDDEGVNLRVLKNQFSLHNYQVDLAANGREALDAVAKNPDYDLVLMDVMMRGLSGYDTCRELRKNYSLFELPILILTAKNHPRSYLEGLDAGANDYLAKPFDKRELYARAKTLLTLKQAVKRAIEHSRHLEAERLKRGLAENLRKITETLTSTLEMDQVLARFLECLGPVAPYDRAVIALLTGSMLEPATLYGYEEARRESLESVHQLISNLYQRVSDNKQPLTLDQPAADACFANLSFMCPTTSILVVPLISNQEISGLLLLERDGPQSFRKQESQLVLAFAGQAAIAIDNARLFEQVQTMAKTEELTGLHNRRHFFVLGKEAFEAAARGESNVSAIMLDVDHFKQINDRFGHSVGDEVLQTVASRIRIACRKTDIIGRYGGEEFAILLPDTPLEIAREVAERLRLEIQKEFPPRDCDEAIVITASLGVAERAPQIQTLADLLRQADRALYAAKDQGRNRTVAYLDIPPG